MKEKLTDKLQALFFQSRDWIRLEIEYAKLTAIEKVTVLMATIIVGAVCLLLGIAVLIMLSFAMVEVFQYWMSPALSYVCGAGVILILILLIYLLRRFLFFNPVSRFMTHLFLSSSHKEDIQEKENKAKEA
ncbi:MAG: hypothetical protein HDS79_08050 [Bacteroidales bacterium]|nr:hypothetical protein [Bacteroidales bacterium]